MTTQDGASRQKGTHADQTKGVSDWSLAPGVVQWLSNLEASWRFTTSALPAFRHEQATPRAWRLF
jgi:hypothetical protein